MSELPIRLRDATLADADMLDAWARSPEAKGEFNDFGSPSPEDTVSMRRSGVARPRPV